MANSALPDGYNPLAGWRVVNDCVVFDSDDIARDEEAPSKFTEAVSRLYSDAKFHRHIVGILGWVGQTKHINSLEIDMDDEGFRLACGVLYRRLMDGPMGAFFDRFGDQAVEDFIICAGGFGPVAIAVAAEIKEKRKMARRAANEPQEGENNDGS